MSSFEKLQEHVFVTKLAGFEHTKYIQNNETREKVNKDDIPLVQGKNIRNGFFVNKYDWYIRKEISDMLKRSKLDKPCILIPYVGSNLGEVGIFYHEYDCHMASNIAKVELIDDYFDIEFLKYYLQSDIGQAYLFQAKQGSAQPNITMEAIRNTLVVDLDINIQYKIAKVLKSIDDKIINNHKINAELESMAKTIYDYWFLQFDFPDENGKPYKSSGGKMVWNEKLKREIPIIFTGKEVSELIEVKDGTHDSPQYISNGKYLITSKHLLNSGINFLEANHITDEDFEAINQRSKVDTGDILFSMIGAIGTIYRVDEEKINFAIKNVALYKTSTSKDFENYLYYTLKSKLMEMYVKRTMAGSIQRFIPLGVLRSMPIAYNENVIKTFSESINDMMRRMTLVKNETRELSALRDFLLPLLMNGQVGFK